jgi:hypothetical protein
MTHFVEIELRKTRTYVGTFQHLDDWKAIGAATIYMREAEAADRDGEEPDFTEPMVQHGLVHFAAIQEGVTEGEIVQALRDTFTKNDCHHEYDCCGCRSFRASAKHVAGPVYKLTIRSSRNF